MTGNEFVWGGSKVWSIPFNDYDETLLVWKYRGKIRGGMFRNRVSAPRGFDIVIKRYSGEIITVYEGTTAKIRSVSDIYFVRKRTEKFIVRNAKELVKSVASHGSELETVFFLNLIKKDSQLERLIKWVGV